MNPNTELVNQAKSGDAHAFAKLYESVYKDLYRFALYTLHHSQDAEDAVSETVLDAFSGIGSLRETEAFKSWIFRILAAKCARRIRQYTEAAVELKDPLPGAPDHLSEQSDVRRALASLDREDRLIISMNIFAGYSSQEIGEQLGLNPNTVRSRQHRALKKMERMLT